MKVGAGQIEGVFLCNFIFLVYLCNFMQIHLYIYIYTYMSYVNMQWERGFALKKQGVCLHPTHTHTHTTRTSEGVNIVFNRHEVMPCGILVRSNDR